MTLDQLKALLRDHISDDPEEDAVYTALLSEIERHERNVEMAKKWDSLTSVGLLGKISEKRLAAILAQFTQTPTL